RLAGVYLNLGARYLNGKVTVARDFMAGLVKALFPEQMVLVEGSSYVDVSLNRIHGKLALNLVNTTGAHDNANVYVYDEILPLGPLQVKMRLDKKPGRVYLKPSDQKLEVDYKDGKLTVIIPRLELYEILVIED
ncbi:hypothetical protein JW964_23810, partial [candidate division KSB1 bacterium]|nr:hypothetical protein [candidate division KSB1 bacterium]